MAKAQNGRNGPNDLQTLKADVKQLRTDLGELVSDLREQGGQSVSELRSRLGTALHDGTEKLKHAADTVGSHVSDGAKKAGETVEEHPFTTAVAAFCAGLIAGTLLGRRTK